MCADQIRSLVTELEAESSRRSPPVSAAMARQERWSGGYESPRADLRNLPKSHRGVTAAFRLLGLGRAAPREKRNAGEEADDARPNCRGFFVAPTDGQQSGEQRAREQNSVKVCEDWNDRLTRLLRELPQAVRARLGLEADPPSDWMEALLRLIHHFHPGGRSVRRMRATPPADGGVLPDLVLEKNLATRGAQSEAIEGVVVYRLEESTDFLTASIAGLQLVQAAVEGIDRGAVQAPHPEAAYLHAAFTALGRCPGPTLRWVSLHDWCWVKDGVWQSDLLKVVGENGLRCLWLTARREADVEVGGVWGDGASTFWALAHAAGELLPEWPRTPYYAVLASPEGLASWLGQTRGAGACPTASSPPWEDNPGWVTDQRGPGERWIGWVLETLARHRPQHVRVRPRREGDPFWFAGVADLAGIDPFTASALVIELSGLLPGRATVPTPRPGRAAESRSGETAGPTRPDRPRRTAPSPTRLKPRQAEVLRILDAARGRRLTVPQICDTWTQGETPEAKSITRAVKWLCDQEPPLATRGDKPRSGAMITEAGRRALGASRRPETG